MKLFGYSNVSQELLLLNEVSVQASPAYLRKLSEFFKSCADDMENNASWEHEHFNDFLNLESAETDLVIVSEDKS